MPIEVLIVEADQAEQIALQSNPQLDQAMKAAFTQRPSVPATCTYRIGSNDFRCSGSLCIAYTNLPANVAFQRVFRNAAGEEFIPKQRPSEAQRMLAGTHGNFIEAFQDIPLTQSGDYSGTWILRAWPEGADYDPTFKSIWNGQLEFPVNFTLQVENWRR